MLYFLCIILIIGVLNKIIHDNNLKKIPLIISVNGIRGKSTATRLITSILHENGLKVVGKTTGTRARIMYGNEMEIPIERGPLGANIGETFSVVKYCSKHNIDALVCECMAVNPEYQKVYHTNILKPNIVVIVNILEDHLDVMGPTKKYIAQAFADSIPNNTKLIISNDEFTDFFKKVAKKKHCEVFVIDEKEVEYNKFHELKYILFPSNIAIAYTVSKILKIKKEIFNLGIIKSLPDPGALRITNIKKEYCNIFFVNAFAANDVESTLFIYRYICNMYLHNDILISVVFNHREDRTDRTIQFINCFFNNIKADIVFFIGNKMNKLIKETKLRVKEILFDTSSDKIIENISSRKKDTILLGVGNINAGAREFLAYLNKEGYNV